jgi:hypothetical protein
MNNRSARNRKLGRTRRTNAVKQLPLNLYPQQAAGYGSGKARESASICD